MEKTRKKIYKWNYDVYLIRLTIKKDESKK